MILSILILSIPERFEKLAALYWKLIFQIGGEDVEVLCLMDNCKRSIGTKRNDLLDAARGEYLAYIDDDDDVDDDYITEILAAIRRPNPYADVIVFKESAKLGKDDPFIVSPGVEYKNQRAQKSATGQWQDITRIPWHWCVWRSGLAKSERFQESNWGEDAAWCQALHPKIKSQKRINKVLRYYYYDKNLSRSGKK
jgi:glycosyltransferase involved in cell wall biosynthesis